MGTMSNYMSIYGQQVVELVWPVALRQVKNIVVRLTGCSILIARFSGVSLLFFEQ
jgi:hypothetical protein